MIFSMEYDEKGLVRIIYSAVWLFIPHHVQKSTQRHQLMCGCEMCIQYGTYKEALNNFHKKRLHFKNECAKSFMSVTYSRANSENISSSYSDLVLTYG